jgi:lysine-ketoglutarate reductase/saccharopine dehydrogenase-like protein (TIGR00300 family)
MFQLPKFIEPDFSVAPFAASPDAVTEKAGKGFLPHNFYATQIFPEYFRINGKWVLVEQSRMDCAVVIREGKPYAVEMRNVQEGEDVVVGRIDNGTAGVYVHANAFEFEHDSDIPDSGAFLFRSGKSRETSYSKDYDQMYDVLRHDRDQGRIVWVLGPACVFDHDSRQAMERLIDNGFCHALFAGNALATHDMEASLFNTGLGQDIYTKKHMANGHYNHLHTINLVREAGSIKDYINKNRIRQGVMSALVRNNIPFVLAGSIRDDGPMPDITADAYQAQGKMRDHIKNATTVIALATQLHTIATGNMTPSYQVVNGVVRPFFFYVVDISEFAVNKLRDRGSLSAVGFVTNIQDFLVNLERNLMKELL